MNILRSLRSCSARCFSILLSKICGTPGRAIGKDLRISKVILSFILIIGILFSFSVCSFADDSVTYRLCTFKLISGSDKPNTFIPVSDDGKTVTKVLYNTSSDIKVTCYQQTNNLKIGTSYTLTYGVKNLSALGNCTVSIFLSDSITRLDNAVTVTEFDTSSCSLSYYNNFSVQFTYPEQFSGKSTYVVVMIVADKGVSGFQVTDFVFTNNDKSEEKIDSILDLLSAVYHGIVGGEDSRGVNHDGLVQGIKNGLSNLGDRISSFFNTLGERISSFFSDLWSNISSGFEAIKDKIAEFGEGIKAKFQEISDNFSSFFDKFKPRVYEEFLWSLGSLDVDGETVFDDRYNAYTSEFISVDNSSGYFLRFSDGLNEFEIYELDVYCYTSSGYFAGYDSYTPSDDDVKLETGYNYRLVIYTSEDLGDFSSYDLSKWCNGKILVYADEGWVNALIHALLNGLKNLFIPSPGYFNSRFENIKVWASEHFGIVYTAGDLSITVLRQFTTLTPPEDPVLNIPSWQMRLPFDNNKVITLVKETQIHFNDYTKEGTPLHSFYRFYKVFITVAFIFMVINYARRKFDYVFGKDGEGVS